MIRPRWEWALETDEGVRLDASLSPVFTTQFDAEQWLGEHWRSLRAAGAAQARLLGEGQQVTPTIVFRAP
ncbi:hypothetical protein ATJ88_2210 [Isoptericola jiangsuensis]|uniref:Uncharacterized protein n=1 Tax=Isoptericola jiangsuensis TaxID=548579 RepID=A0A2A9EXQ4_9MICO|nr:hypothetical protein [Isoptericola jiangsuensis]PFG43513.1 hypothetical protein ATJ88_2210 [Isoptericola jiangsuensis]